MSDLVNHPPHYNRNHFEVIDVIEGSVDNFTSYCHGNVIKYVTRAIHKGNYLEDMRKAKWYLDRLLESEQALDMQEEYDYRESIAEGSVTFSDYRQGTSHKQKQDAWELRPSIKIMPLHVREMRGPHK